MNLNEAKKLFEKHHPNKAHILKKDSNNEAYRFAAIGWVCFKSALKDTGQLED